MNESSRSTALAATVLASLATAAGAVGITGTKLIIVDKPSAPAKIVYVSKLDDGIDKGAEGDPMLVSGSFVVTYNDPGTAPATFDMPAGDGWLVNKAAVLKYVNKSAPTGGGTCDGTSPPLLQGLPCGIDDDCGGGACTGGSICDPLIP